MRRFTDEELKALTLIRKITPTDGERLDEFGERIAFLVRDLAQAALDAKA